MTSISGALAAKSKIGVARGVSRSRPARLSMTPTSEWVRLSTRPRLVRRLGVPHVRDVRITVHRQPAGRVSVVAGCVEGEHRDINDVAFIRDDDALALNRITNLAQHDQPGFG